MTHQPLTTEELDALAALRTDAHNQCAANPFSRDAHTAVTKYHAAIVGDGERLIEQAREATGFQAAAITNLIIAKREEARADKLEADSEINTRMLMSVNRCCDIEKARAESAIASRDSLRERLEIAMLRIKHGIHEKCDGKELLCDSLICSGNRAALAAIAAKAGTGGKGEGE